MIELKVKTKNRVEFIDLTAEIRDTISKNGYRDGLLTIFVPHTTAGITINENADGDVITDIVKSLEKLVPFKDGYLHIEGNSDAHIKSSLIGSSVSIIIENGELKLGVWQGIYFCEFDGPRTRTVWMKFIRL